MTRSTLINHVYYLIAVAIVGAYGFISAHALSKLQLLEVLGTLGLFFLVAGQIQVIHSRYVKNNASLQRSIKLQRLFLVDVLLFGAVALSIYAAQIIGFGKETLSVVFIPFGVLVIGFFATIDNALQRQREWFVEKGDALIGGDFSINPLGSKLSLTLALSLVITVMTVVWTTVDALQSIPNLEQRPAKEIFKFLALPLFLVLATLMGLVLQLIASFTRNLQLALQAQRDALQDVQNGVLDTHVPVMAQDELGLVAMQINQMIDHLRDRDRLYKTLERLVGPNVLNKLLNTDQETLKKGQQQEVAILFCDMRDFTSMTEVSSTEEMIYFLNAFFSDLSDLVTKNNGMVNKFMGDAILAVYTFESTEHPVDDAVRTTLEILEHTQSFTLPDGSCPQMGSGIHFGSVVAGTIGSNERYEYTFMGDVVNTASRLEGLTKRLKYNIIISDTAYDHLLEETRDYFDDLGDHRVRGKSDALHVFGHKKDNSAEQNKKPDDDAGPRPEDLFV